MMKVRITCNLVYLYCLAVSLHAFYQFCLYYLIVFWRIIEWSVGNGSYVITCFAATATETVAYPQADGTYTLHGYKWFTSATDADMALTLARVADAR